MARKDDTKWHGPGFLHDRNAKPLPHMGGPKGIGAEGPKRLQPKGAAKPKPSENLKDKYGRAISREEYNRREKYRESRKGMTAAQAERAAKVEKARREKYRQTEGKKQYGAAAEKVTRNKKMATGVSSRYVAAKTKRAVKGTGSGTVSSAVAKGIRDKYAAKPKKKK